MNAEPDKSESNKSAKVDAESGGNLKVFSITPFGKRDFIKIVEFSIHLKRPFCQQVKKIESYSIRNLV